VNLGRQIAIWISRHLLALAVILVILIVGRYAAEPAGNWLRGQLEASRTVTRQTDSYSAARASFELYAERRHAEVRRATEALTEAPDDRLRERRAEIERIVARERAARLSGLKLALAAARGDTARVFAHYRAGTEIALLGRERAAIDALLAASPPGGRTDLDSRRRRAEVELRETYHRWRAAAERARALDERFLAGPRNFLCGNANPVFGCENYRALIQARAERDSALEANRAAVNAIRTIDRARSAAASARRTAADANAAIAGHRQSLDAELRALEKSAGDNWVLWIKKPVLEMLPTALLILAVAIFGPALIKAFLYFAIAPIAARRPPIRLLPDDRGEVSDQDLPSAPSRRIPIGEGNEILVVPEAVQSSPHDADKATKWLLDWKMPVSSLAAGLVALLRVRAPRPDFVQLGSTGDPLAEIATIEIGAGSAMVLRPRALRGLVQPIGRPLRITRRWQLGTLSAWLTLQFRYLVFHGPCTLIVQGGRGVRLERAASGRGINQASTIGFSAGLDYSVRRSEAFGPYLMGKQELLNDSFDGHGCSLYEVLPRDRTRGGIWGRGIRGLGDAFLKIFGV
jgi:hypothetical protein